MRNPVVDVESGARSLEVAIVEDEQVLVLLRQALNHMRLALREIPDIALVQDFVLIAAVFVNSANGDLAMVHVAPFCDTVPVELANAAFGQVLLSACDVVAGWEIGDDLFSDPAAGELAGFGVGEAPFEVLYGAGVGGFLA
jgi:hypothetical protein